jgi:hypothetical protein
VESKTARHTYRSSFDIQVFRAGLAGLFPGSGSSEEALLNVFLEKCFSVKKNREAGAVSEEQQIVASPKQLWLRRSCAKHPLIFFSM